MTTATVSSKGQLTLPKEIRTALGVGPGDKVTFVKMDDGNYAVVPATSSVMELKGFLSKPSEPVSLEDMDRAIAKGAAGR